MYAIMLINTIQSSFWNVFPPNLNINVKFRKLDFLNSPNFILFLCNLDFIVFKIFGIFQNSDSFQQFSFFPLNYNLSAKPKNVREKYVIKILNLKSSQMEGFNFVWKLRWKEKNKNRWRTVFYPLSSEIFGKSGWWKNKHLDKDKKSLIVWGSHARII